MLMPSGRTDEPARLEAPRVIDEKSEHHSRHVVSIPVSNTGRQSISLVGFKASCDCSGVVGLPVEIPAGQTTHIKVEFKLERAINGIAQSKIRFITDTGETVLPVAVTVRIDSVKESEKQGASYVAPK
jgi:hypothetical protein